ncbi:MAG: hypothetical protein HOW73_36640 [Polyangiaceae bacterium]|nr:hypothetical protein [Polyangiaceae bacterium]
MTTKPTKRFTKPRFDALLMHYSTDPETVHTCAILNPTAADDGINTCAARLSEALCLANGLATDRTKIRGSNKKGDVYPLLGPYNYKLFGNLCNHGIARGARDLGDFLTHHWGQPKAYSNLAGAPAEIQDKTGVLCFVKIPGYSGQGHVDVWNKSDCVGHGYWDSAKVWFWELT